MNSSMRILILVLFAFCSQATLTAKSATTLYPLSNETQKTRFHYLLKELRCLVCQNQDLADSNASLAKDLRDQVYVMLNEGKNDREIRNYLTARYGDFILFEPPFKALTLFLWLGPALFLLLGLFVFWRICFRAKSL